MFVDLSHRSYNFILLEAGHALVFCFILVWLLHVGAVSSFTSVELTLRNLLVGLPLLFTSDELS